MDTIVICGAGFAGLDTALLLRKKVKNKIIVINKEKFHNFTPSMPDLAIKYTKIEKLRIGLDKVFKKKIEFVQDTIVRIDLERKVVVTKNNTVPYNILILALGAEPNIPEGDLPYYTIEDAAKLDFDCTDPKPIIIKGEYGIELAATLRHHFDKVCKKKKIGVLDINIVLPIIKNEKLKVLLEEYFKHNNIAIVSELREGIVINSTIKPNSIYKDSNLPVFEDGSLKVNNHLQVEGYDHIFALGDSIKIEDMPFDWSALRATQQAAIVADNVMFMLNKQPMLEYKSKDNPVLLRLGKNYGIFANKDKISKGYHIAKLKKIVEKHHLFTRRHGKVMNLVY